MDQGLHFISGLPRSGSTLLAGILRQNPRFHAGMTSPVGGIFLAMQEATSRKAEMGVFVDEAQKRALLAGVFDGYYHDIHREQVVFDTNRIWCTKLPALAELFPSAKVICCVRHIPWIMDSVERLVRRNAFDLTGMFGFESGGTVFTRVNRMAGSDGMVGYALDALKEAYYGDWADRLIVVTYEALTRDPAGTLAILYDFIGEAPFAHDFAAVEYSADEFDATLGAKGLHQVRRKVEFVERPTVLPPELFQRFENDAFWMNPELNRCGVQVIRLAEAAD
jgi:sulfotransferase